MKTLIRPIVLLCALSFSVPAFAGRASCSIEGPYNRCSISCRYWFNEQPACTCDDEGWVHCTCVTRYLTSTGIEVVLWDRPTYKPVEPIHRTLLEGLGATGQLAAAALQGALDAMAAQDYAAYESSVLQYNSALQLLSPEARHAVDDLVTTIE